MHKPSDTLENTFKTFYPGGRKTPWFYKDSDGNWHKTSGMEARPYLRPSISDHQKEYIEIIKDELRS